MNSEKKKDNHSANPPTAVTGHAPVNGIQMYYEIHGQGEPLVLVHGGGSTIQTTFSYSIPLLAKHFKIIAVELQAHGRSSDRDAPESFEQDADDVAALLKHLGIAKASFFGFSNGGNTCMQIAIRHPQISHKIVAASAFYKRSGMLEGFFEGLAKATLDDMPAELKADFLAVNNDTAALQNMFNKDRERMVTFKDWSDETLQKIQAPALIIMGDKDIASPEHAAEMSRKIPKGELLILPGNHGSYMGEGLSAKNPGQIPPLTIEVIREFLQKK